MISRRRAITLVFAAPLYPILRGVAAQNQQAAAPPNAASTTQCSSAGQWLESERQEAIVTIAMKGTPRGERVWFEPNGVAVPLGTRLRFVNEDPGNSHTATCFHPDLYGQMRRIPVCAQPWESGFLLPDQSFETVLTLPGVYDYYCLPHLAHGMVGRIVVGNSQSAGWVDEPYASDLHAPTGKGEFVAVGEILAHKSALNSE